MIVSRIELSSENGYSITC